MKELMANEVVSFCDCYCIRESDKAMLIRIVETGDEAWIPKSQIVNRALVEGKQCIRKLIITKWIARQKQLI
jgi:hypothetical protein